MNRQRQAEPGSRVRLGGESRAVGRYRGARVPLDKKDIGRAELRNVRRAQLPEPFGSWKRMFRSRLLGMESTFRTSSSTQHSGRSCPLWVSPRW